MELVIDRGVKSYDVKDVDGTLLGVIKINPADIGISGRFVSARNAIAELAEQAKQDMTPEKICRAKHPGHPGGDRGRTGRKAAERAALPHRRGTRQPAEVLAGNG